MSDPFGDPVREPVDDAAGAAERASRLLLTSAPTLGGIRLGVVDGPSGSGKSTFARRWARALRPLTAGVVTVFSSDLLATWDDPFGWWDRFDAGVLQPLSTGRPGRVRLTDWSGGAPIPGRWRTVRPPKVLILEGVSCGRLALGDRVGTLVWVEVQDRQHRLERAVGRDGAASRDHLAHWQDDEDTFFNRDRTRARADLILQPT